MRASRDPLGDPSRRASRSSRTARTAIVEVAAGQRAGPASPTAAATRTRRGARRRGGRASSSLAAVDARARSRARRRRRQRDDGRRRGRDRGDRAGRRARRRRARRPLRRAHAVRGRRRGLRPPEGRGRGDGRAALPVASTRTPCTLPRDPRGRPDGRARPAGWPAACGRRSARRLCAGAPFVLDAVGFDARLRAARALIVGEGRLDDAEPAGQDPRRGGRASTPVRRAVPRDRRPATPWRARTATLSAWASCWRRRRSTRSPRPPRSSPGRADGPSDRRPSRGRGPVRSRQMSDRPRPQLPTPLRGVNFADAVRPPRGRRRRRILRDGRRGPAGPRRAAHDAADPDARAGPAPECRAARTPSTCPASSSRGELRIEHVDDGLARADYVFLGVPSRGLDEVIDGLTAPGSAAGRSSSRWPRVWSRRTGSRPPSC